jgi:hypothetical protein
MSTDFSGSMVIVSSGNTGVSTEEVSRITQPSVWEFVDYESDANTTTLWFEGYFSGVCRDQFRAYFHEIAERLGEVTVLHFVTDQDEEYYFGLVGTYTRR